MFFKKVLNKYNLILLIINMKYNSEDKKSQLSKITYNYLTPPHTLKIQQCTTKPSEMASS